MSDQVQDKTGNPIEVGDTVFTKFRGGHREGKVIPSPLFHDVCLNNAEIWKVEKIVTTKEEAEKEGVKNPPKVGRCPFHETEQ